MPLGATVTETHTIEVQDIQMAELIIYLQELRRATNNFSATNVIGEGASSLVCKGEHNSIKVAVKRMVSKEGDITIKHQIMQLQSEILALSKFGHHNFVSMLGYYPNNQS